MSETDLLNMLKAEFDNLGLPFKVKPINRIQLASIDNIYTSPSSLSQVWEVQILSECSQEEQVYLYKLFEVYNIMRQPRVDMIESTRDLFADPADALAFLETQDNFYSNIYRLTTQLELTEHRVNYFIAQLREHTEPLRRKRYEEQFNNQVDNHLSEPEYNKDNGHKQPILYKHANQ